MEQETFNGLMLRYRGLLFSVCRHYSRRGLDEDDLLQEVMLALWRRREQLAALAPAPRQAAWMWRVARSTCVDLVRRTPVLQEMPHGYDEAEDDNAQHAALVELIGLLPEPDRTIATLHLEGYSYKEIGQRTGLQANNVGVRLTRIKNKLKEQWNGK